MIDLRTVWISAVCGLLLICGCGPGKGDSSEDKSESDPKSARSSKPVPNETLNAAQVLIAFRGCDGADNVTRSRAEALEIATEVAAKSREGADFTSLVKQYSDARKRNPYGSLGNFEYSENVRQISDQVYRLKVGEVSEPFESQFGFHIVERREVQPEYIASHLFLVHADSPIVAGQKGKPVRSKEEAIKLAKEIRQQVLDGEDFNQLAKRFSEIEDRKRGGSMGRFTIEELPEHLTEVGRVAAKLEVGEVSEPFESAMGVHLAIRHAEPPKAVTYSAKHILVSYRGARQAKVTRSKAEALERMKTVQKKLAAGEKFEDLAKEYSDGPTGAVGGELGTFELKAMTPPFAKAVEACKVGSNSDIVETAYGFHIIYRYK